MIIVNYDLLHKIQEAKGNFVIQSGLKGNIKFAASGSLGLTLLSLYLKNGRIDGSTISIVPFAVSYVALSKMLIEYLMNKEDNKEKAINQLRLLSYDLSKNGIKTSGDLLLDAVCYKTEYEPIKSDKGIPCNLMQKKYILIPTYDDGSIRETSIVQEHEFNTNVYVLSFGSPTRSLRPVTVNT